MITHPHTLFEVQKETPLSDGSLLPAGTILSVSFYDEEEYDGEILLYLETDEYGKMKLSHEDVKKIFRDPEYFTRDVNESLNLAAKNINAVLDVLQDEGINMSLEDTLHDQMVPLSRVVQFFGCMIAAHQQEIAQLKTEVAQLREQQRQ